MDNYFINSPQVFFFLTYYWENFLQIERIEQLSFSHLIIN